MKDSNTPIVRAVLILLEFLIPDIPSAIETAKLSNPVDKAKRNMANILSMILMLSNRELFN